MSWALCSGEDRGASRRPPAESTSQGSQWHGCVEPGGTACGNVPSSGWAKQGSGCVERKGAVFQVHAPGQSGGSDRVPQDLALTTAHVPRFRSQSAPVRPRTGSQAPSACDWTSVSEPLAEKVHRSPLILSLRPPPGPFPFPVGIPAWWRAHQVNVSTTRDSVAWPIGMSSTATHDTGTRTRCPKCRLAAGNGPPQAEPKVPVTCRTNAFCLTSHDFSAKNAPSGGLQLADRATVGCINCRAR
jgi:hypothetical protein